MKEMHPTYKAGKWKEEIIAAGLLMAFAFFINRGIEIKGLYMDDLYLWSCYGEQSFLEFVAPLGSTRFRFIYYLMAWLELGFIGTHIDWIVPINIILNGCIAYTVYRFGKRLSKNWLIGFTCGFLYLLSRMSYYQIGQVYGLMESMALWAAIGILYCLYRYLHEEELEKRYFVWANVLYFTICFIHERYMVLLPLFYLTFLFKKEKKPGKWLVTTGVFLAMQAVRFLTIGSFAPAGTGGTDVADTFHVTDALRYAVDQVLYIFGINAGPSHLSGQSWQESPFSIHLLVVLADFMLVFLVVMFIRRLWSDKGRRNVYLTDTCLFLVFIALCIGSSSVTIRVETRWIYVSMTAAYLFAAYLYGVVTSKEVETGDVKEKTQKKFYQKNRYGVAVLCGGALLLYAVLMIPVESHYRTKYPQLYFWSNQLRYNSLAEETHEKYGDSIFGKEIYILGTSYQMSDFTARTFFKEFDRERKAEGTTVKFIESIHDIGLVTNNMLLIRENPEHQAFQDITDFVRNLKCEPVYGYYSDGWVDESAKLRVMAGKSGVIHLELYYPGAITGGEITKIFINGEPVKEIRIDANMMKTEILADPGQIAELAIENNFYYEEAKEQRGEKRFSMIIHMTAD